MINLLRSFVVLGALAFAFCVSAQETPEGAALSYFEAIEKNGFQASADCIHPDELARFKSMLMPLFSTGDRQQKEDWADAFFGDQWSAKEVVALPPREFTRAFIKFMERQAGLDRIKIGEVKVLGTVAEGDLVHVLTRTSAGTEDVQIAQLHVLTMIPDGAHWKLTLPAEIEGAVQALMNKLESSSK